jgi:hypothetical protein
MAEQTRTSANIPASPACGQWETLLADALDGQLRPEEEGFFASHRETCPFCSALYDEARRGREWLDFLALEPEIPSGLVDKILAQTGPGFESGPAAGYGVLPGQMQPATLLGGAAIPAMHPWQRPGFRRGFMGFARRMAQPRLMMTAAMAFFSIALTLNLTGVKPGDLRPRAVRSYMERQFAFASTPIVRYYDHLRLVNEVQTRMKELRESTQVPGQAPGQNPGQNQEQQQTPSGGSGSGSGESERTPGHKDGGSHLAPKADPPQQSARPILRNEDFIETSLVRKGRAAHSFEARSVRGKERSLGWIA